MVQVNLICVPEIGIVYLIFVLKCTTDMDPELHYFVYHILICVTEFVLNCAPFCTPDMEIKTNMCTRCCIILCTRSWNICTRYDLICVPGVETFVPDMVNLCTWD